MGEAKPIASLSSTLLARKGHAKPAMRPQGFQNFGFGAPHAIEDLGWNDMGGEPHAAPAPAASPSEQPVARLAEVVPITPHAQPIVPTIDPPVVHRQREDIAREMASPVIEPAEPAPAGAEPTESRSPVEQVADVDEKGERRRNDRARAAVTAEVERVVVARAVRGSKGKAAFTLRLDSERHLRLRLAGAFAHRSSQAIVVEALDTYLDTLPRVIELARDIAARTDDAPDAELQAQAGDNR